MFSKLDKKYTDLSRQTMGRIYKAFKQVALMNLTYTSTDKLKETLMNTDRYLDRCLIDFALAVFTELDFLTITKEPQVRIVMNSASQQTELSRSRIYNKITEYTA
jgi:ssDNA-specific exonuclease RecJ